RGTTGAWDFYNYTGDSGSQGYPIGSHGLFSRSTRHSLQRYSGSSCIMGQACYLITPLQTRSIRACAAGISQIRDSFSCTKLVIIGAITANKETLVVNPFGRPYGIGSC